MSGGGDATVFAPSPRVLLPVVGDRRRFPVRHIHCVGRNYADHVREMGADPDREPPVFFAKPAHAAVGGRTAFDVSYPPRTGQLEHEVELVVAVGPGSRVFGYAVGIDLTRRDLQAEAKAHGGPWEAAKAFSQSAPVGPIRPAGDRLESGRIHLAVNGRTRQDGDLAAMTWSVDEILDHLAADGAVAPGDLVFTGTPAGVGPVRPGDVMTAGIGGLDQISVTMTERHGP